MAQSMLRCVEGANGKVVPSWASRNATCVRWPLSHAQHRTANAPLYACRICIALDVFHRRPLTRKTLSVRDIRVQLIESETWFFGAFSGHLQLIVSEHGNHSVFTYVL